MTVSSSTARADYNGNGVTVDFAVPFRFLTNTDIQVLRTLNGVSTILVLNSLGADGFSVDGAGQPSGGEVHCVTAPAVGETLTILRAVSRTQLTNYIPNDPFPAESHERALDKLTMIVQELDESISRSITLPPGLPGLSTTLPLPEALWALRWNAAENGLENFLVTPLSTPSGSDLVGFLQAGTAAVGRTLQAKQRETLSATDYSGVDPTGVADSTAGINAALQYAKSVGKRCYLPSGIYKISASIIVPGGTELVGEGWQPYTAYATTATLGKGTLIHVTHTGTPAILVQKDGSNRTSGASIRNLAMYWDHAVPGPGWVPTVYDWAIKVDKSDDVLIEDVLMVNPYLGITITGTSGEPSGRLNLNRVYGQPLLTGVQITYSVDVSTLNRVHFWPFWSDDANVRSWMKANNSCAIRCLRSDNTQISNIFGFGYANGIQITGDGTGTTLRLEGVNIDFDDCVRGFHVAASAGNSSGVFVNFGATANPATATADLFVIEPGICDYDFVNLTLANSQQSGIRVTGNGSRLRVCNLWINQWNIQAAANPAIYVGADARVDVTQGKYFTGNGGPLLQEVGNGIGAIGEWMAYAPTLATGAGTLTSATATGRKRRVGNTVNVEADVVITTNGTGATSVIVGLPYTAAANAIFYGRERNAIGFGCSAQVLSGGTTMVLTKTADNAYPGASNHTLTVSGTYEV